MRYDNPTFQWAKVILGVLMLAALALIGTKVMQPQSKDTYASGSLPSQPTTKVYSILYIGGCATTKAVVSSEAKK
jgi:NADH:ubiquinone oxidoreductase subunit 3 (subunit A)